MKQVFKDPNKKVVINSRTIRTKWRKSQDLYNSDLFVKDLVNKKKAIIKGDTI